MNIADKTLQLKKDFDDVYKAGQSSMVDESKIIEKTVSGEYISVDDVSEIPHEVKVMLTSGGNNKLPYPYVDTTKTVNGITFTDNGDGTITANGTSTDLADFMLHTNFPIKAGMVISGVDGGTSLTYEVQAYTNQTNMITTNTNSTSHGNTCTADFIATSVRIRIRSGVTLNNLVFKPMLSFTPNIPYEPYKKTLTDYSGVSFTKCVANLWKNGDRTFIQMSESMPVKLLAGITYTFSADVTTTDTDYGYCLVYDATNNIVLGYLLLDGVKSITFTPIANIEHIWLYASRTRAAGEGDTATFKNIMLNEGSTALPYEPYNAQTLTANADGTVEGVKSISPRMYLTTDNQNVTINATYHRSYGIQTEYDRFWDSFQDYGNRQNYSYGFAGHGWTNDTFKPKYSLSDAIINDHLYMFNNSRISEIDCDLNVSYNPSVSYLFAGNINLKKVKSVMLHASATGGDSCFRGTIALEDVTFKNAIPCAFDFHWSTKLSKATILNIFEHLSSTVTGQTLTLSKTAVTNAFGSTTATEWTNLVATKTNWTISLV